MNTSLYEAEVHQGIERIAADEIQEVLCVSQSQLKIHRGRILFEYSGPSERLLSLRTVIAIYSVLNFEVSRPKALLGHAHWKRLEEQIASALVNAPRHIWKTSHLSAAGADSTVLQRLRREIAAVFHLQDHSEEGDLWIRLRHDEPYWQTLVRISPRPLVTRSWRVAHLEGALNAGVAHAMLRMLNIQPDDHLLNLCAGSATFLIERSAYHTGGCALGIDWSVESYQAGQANLNAWGRSERLRYVLADVCKLPLADNSFSMLCADLPFGQRMGSSAENKRLYPCLLSEAARVAQLGAKFAVLTHAVRLIRHSLDHQKAWRCVQEQMIVLRGLHPRIYILQRV
ncbi:MAG: RNA methyltransferase [Anaerolineae bacterium]|nr:RNA methyltransferase [Anaerolineae bacterium]